MSLSIVTELYVSGAWTSYPSFHTEGWSTRVGPDVESGTQPNQVVFTLKNLDQSMDPTNVSSALYGLIGQNTPARIRVSGGTLTQAEASNWEPDAAVEYVQGSGRGRAWVTLTAEGLLRRLGRWEDPLDSPMVRQTSSYGTLIGHMPLEDESGAQNLTQLVAGVRAGFYQRTVTLGGDPGAGGSAPCAVLGSDGQIGGFFKTPSGNGYQIMIAAKLAAAPGSATSQPIFQWADTLGRTWRWLVNNSTFSWDVTDADGTVLSSSSSTWGVSTPAQWIRYRMKVTVSGSTLTYEPAWYVQDSSFSSGITSTFSSSATGRPRGWSANGSTVTSGAAYTGVFAVTDTTQDLINTYNVQAAFNGYLGERAGNRFARIMGELGLTGYVGGDANQSVPMGRQKPAKAQDILEECVRTDAGIMYDEPLDIAVTMRCNNDLINRSVALALTKGVDVAAPLRKIIGDVNVANDVTASNSDGTQVRVEQTTGTKSTQVPPAGVGRYRKTLDVSVAYPPQLVDRASFEVAEGTIDRPRYQTITLNLHALASSYRTAVTNMRPGDIISLAGVEKDTIYLRVITIGRSGNAVEDVATLSCLPADNWLPSTYDDATRRLDSSSTTLGSTVTSAATSLTFSTANRGDVWSTVDAPYDVLIAGERITVTAMGAISGTGPWTQTATVTRAVNAVSKAQTAGAEIHVFRPARYALGGF